MKMTLKHYTPNLNELLHIENIIDSFDKMLK